MKELRKALVVAVMSITVLSMSMLALPFEAGAVAQAGDLIKMDGLSSVYFLGGDNKRYVFPNESTYFSWYSDFSGVVTIPQSELESYSLGANVTVRPGTKLVKITTDPKVYAVTPGGNLLHVASEAAAKALWGDDWAKRVIDVSDAFFTNYTIATGQVSETAYPAGSLIKLPDASDVYYIAADGKARKVVSESAFLANRFKFSDVVTTAAGFTLPTLGDDITGAVANLTDTSEGAGGTAGAGTGLTVAISGDTPAAGNVPENSPVDFLEVRLTASNDGAVNVNSIKFSAFDLGTATNLRNVTVYRDGVKQGTAVNMTSDRTATINFATPIAVAAGQTVTLKVRASIFTGASGNYAIGINRAADVITNGAVVSGSFPIIGNSKAVVTGVDIGTVIMSGVDSVDNDNVQFGTDDVRLAFFSLQANNEPVLWESAMFRNAGTNNTEILSNLRLLIDGDEVATTPGLTVRDVIFNLNNYVIPKGRTVTVEVIGDIGTASVSNTVNLYVRDAGDLVFVGQDFGFGILPTIHADLDGAGDGITVTLASGDFSIDMDRAATPSKDVRSGTDDVVLATVKMTSNGENATLDGIAGSPNRFYITGTGLRCTAGDSEIDNVELFEVGTGVIHTLTVASSTVTAGVGICDLSTTDEIFFQKGVTKTFQVRADLQGPTDTNPLELNDTLQVVLTSAAISGRITGQESDANITNITPSSVSSGITTIKQASLTWTTVSLVDQTVVPGAKDIVVYRAGLEVGQAAGVEISSVKIDVFADNGSLNGSFIDNNISRLGLYLDGKLLKNLSNQIVEAAAPGGSITFNALDAANRKLAAGANVFLEVKADFAASFSTTSTWSLNVDSNASMTTRDVDNNAIDESVPNVLGSRNITLASTGTLKAELLITDVKADVNTYILAGAETTKDRYMGELKFTTANERIKVKTLVLGQASSTTGADIAAIRLYDKNGVMVAQKAPSAAGHANFDTLNLELPADSATSLFIGIVAKSINAEGDAAGTATFGRVCIFDIASNAVLTTLAISDNKAVTAQGIDSGNDITIVPDLGGGVAVGEYAASTSPTREAKVTGSVLTSIVNALTDGVLTNGNGRTIGKYTFVFDNGANRTTAANAAGANLEMKAELNSLTLTLATSSANVANIQAYIEGNSANKTTAVAPTNSSAVIDLTSLTGTTELVDGTVTLVIVGDITGVTTNGTVQTEINSLLTDFTYNGNNGDGDNFVNARLDISEVIGGTLSN